MSELCGAAANVQLSKLESIVAHMRASNHRIQSALEGTPGLSFRRLNDPEGDSGPFLCLMLEDADKARRTADRINEGGIKDAWHLPAYGMHIYYNVPQLAGKVPLSAAGNPWSLAENAGSVYDYGKGACPRSDALFGRSVLVSIPSRLTAEQEDQMVEVIRKAVT